MALPFHRKGSIEEQLARQRTSEPDEAPPDAAWYEQQRLKALARATGVSVAVVAAASAAVTASSVPSLDVKAGASGILYTAGRTIGDIAGQVVGALKRRLGRRFTPKIRQADVKPPNRIIPPPEHWARDMVADFKRKRVPGVDISVVYFTHLVEKACEKLAKDGRGFWQRSYRAMAKLAAMGRETVRKGMDWLRDNGWVGVLNGLARDDASTDRREDRRDKYEANIYFPLTKKEATEIAAVPPEARPAKWEAITLARGAAIFGLHARDRGLNASPARSNRDMGRTSPAPA